MFRLLIASAVFALASACGADTPVPEYPFPRQAPLEETSLAQYVGGGEEAIDEEEDEEWDDGLSDEDMQMDSSTPETPAPAEGAEGEAEDAEAAGAN